MGFNLLVWSKINHSIPFIWIQTITHQIVKSARKVIKFNPKGYSQLTRSFKRINTNTIVPIEIVCAIRVTKPIRD